MNLKSLRGTPLAGCVLLLVCVAFSGCGGSESGSRSRTAPAAPEKAAERHESTSTASTVKVKYDDLSINQAGDKTGSLPLAPAGLTVVSLFDDFCMECAGGNRLRTLEKLEQTTRGTKILAVFSADSFTEQDVENLKLMLDVIPQSMVRGSTKKVQSNMVSQQLLVVFNSRKEVVWQETPGMSEDEIYAAVKRAIEAGAA
ncbi:MAG TPA: hypothetical protein VM934_03645 [Pyrinomonadaceae bacterium]|nr:hypothetical protein [Pyrinomonadaceae bacterium]